MNETAHTATRTDYLALLELATPYIYCRNVFRVLGLPVHAKPRDVQRQQNRRKMQERLGVAATGPVRSPLALDPIPGDEDMRAAMERLNRPVDRLLDEVFWFWPMNGNVAGDVALTALDQNDVDTATQCWTEQARVASHSHIAIHNLAVLDHLVALDGEVRLASLGLPTKEQEHLGQLWLRTFARWQQVLNNEEFWSVVTNRVRDMNDVQLTTSFVHHIRDTLPLALLLINAKLAYSAAERADADSAQRHIRLLHQANFGNGVANDAIRESLKPVRNRIKTATDSAKSRWTRTPQHGNRYVRELHEQAKSLLAVVDVVLPSDDLTRAGLHDTLAEAMLEGQVAFGKKTNDWLESIKLLQLAQELAVGQAVQTRLADNIETLEKNQKSTNDWYSPGYWELPEETIVRLEEAHVKSTAEDHEGAIRLLIVLDPAIGKPLQRCLAFSLSQRAWQIADEGLDAFNTPTNTLQKFLTVLERRGSVSVPHSQMPSWQLPDCPCCGRSNYTQWSNGEYKGQRFWMCKSCSEADDREREQKKHTRRKCITEGLEYALLASELDPHDPGIGETVKTLKKFANDISATVPKTAALKKRLGGEKIRVVPHTFAWQATGMACHFCGANAADESCQITVPMCGDPRPVDLLFEKGTEYRSADVGVPRCRRCRDEHRELPGRIEQWHDARVAAEDDEHFPDVVAAVTSAAESERRAVAEVGKARKAMTATQANKEQADAIGSECERCHSKTSWRKNLCRSCDSTVFHLSGLSKVAIAVTAMLTLVGVLVLQQQFAILSPVSGTLALFIGLVLMGGLKQKQRQQRRALSEQRQVDIERRRSTAIATATKKLAQAASALQSAEQTEQQQKNGREEAKKKLKAEKEKALAQFEQLHPEPTRASGIQPESAYGEFSRITELCTQGWGFGHKPDSCGKPVTVLAPQDVKGLVGREPRPYVATT
ncbi:MAG: hypothetical protein HYZ50_20085 [Deltaproteobacteria bacterium]|nr:hypothetical protein [Deltaproteobacteria bacterium]